MTRVSCGDVGGLTFKGKPCGRPAPKDASGTPGRCALHGEDSDLLPSPPGPVHLTPEQVEQVETLAAVLTTEQIAHYFGMSASTFLRIRDRDPDVLTRYQRGRARAIFTVASNLLTRARRSDTAGIFYLKTQAGWSEKSKVEVSGPDGGPLEVLGKAIQRLPSAEVERLLALPDTELREELARMVASGEVEA